MSAILEKIKFYNMKMGTQKCKMITNKIFREYIFGLVKYSDADNLGQSQLTFEYLLLESNHDYVFLSSFYL